MGTTGLHARVYAGGRAVAHTEELDEACRLRALHPGDLVVIVVAGTDEADLVRLGAEFGLPSMAVEDALEAHQRAKFDRYGDTAFVVLRPARYLDEPETVELGELHLFIGPDFAIAVARGVAPDVHAILDRLDAEPWLTGRGGLGVLYAALDVVVDGYVPVLDGLENDVDEIEDQVFAGGEHTVARRIYELARETIALQRAVHPLQAVLRNAGFVVGAQINGGHGNGARVEVPGLAHDLSDDLKAGIADVWDHAHSVGERVDGLREALTDILQTNATLVGLDQNARTERLSELQVRQNEQVKKISAWAAVFVAPTLLSGIWGMNFERMPEMDWRFGYPAALLVMLGVSVALYLRFKRIHWL
ncbi:MAG: magnesium and cobalt transport protein CorA [Kineosporiaceae bacterium]